MTIVDENTIHVIFTVLATVLGTFLALLGVFVVFKHEAYDKRIKTALEEIMECEEKVELAEKGNNKESANKWRKYLKAPQNQKKAYEAEQTEYIKKFLFTASLIFIALIFSIIILLISKILVNLNLGIMVVFSGVAFSIFVIFLTFLFIVGSFPIRYEQYRNDMQPKSKWYQFWKWVEWDELFLVIR